MPPLEYTLYISAGGAWHRGRLTPGPGADDFPAFVHELIETAQAAGPVGASAPPAGAPIAAASEPNGIDARFQNAAALRALLKSSAWQPRGPLLLGEHAATLLSFCRANARWLLVRATPEQVALMRRAQLPVVGADAEQLLLDAGPMTAARSALRRRVPADLASPGPLRAGLRMGQLGAMTVAAQPRNAEGVPVASAALRTWLRGWADAGPASPPLAGAALQSELQAAFRDLGRRARGPFVVTEAGALVTLIALAAWNLEQGLLNAGQAAPWMTLGLQGAEGAALAISFPLDAGLRGEPARVGPYQAWELAPNPAAPVRRDRYAAFRLNKGLRDHLIEHIPAGLTPTAREAWMAQQLVPEVQAVTDAPQLRPFPATGLLAFTPFGELWVLPSAGALTDFLTAAKRRAAAIGGASLTWEALANTSQGSMWVPLLSHAQLEATPTRRGGEGRTRGQWAETASGGWRKRGVRQAATAVETTWAGLSREEVARYSADMGAPDTAREEVQGMWGRSIIPQAARPYQTDSRVRALAFAAAFAGEPMDWITSDSIIRNAFLGTPEKVLLPAGTVVYKFNDFTSLFMPKTGALDTRAVGLHLGAQDRISPWWSPWDGWEHGGGWGQRLALSRQMAGQLAEAARRAQAEATMGTAAASAAALSAARATLGAWGPLLEMARLTSVVKENWNSLRYVVAIELVRPVYAFFGGFGSLNRIDMEPAGSPSGSWPPAPVQRRVGETARLSWSKAKDAETGRTEDLSVASRRTVLRGMELPGGSTQLYITGLRWFHPEFGRDGNFVLYSIDDPSLAAWAVESVPHATDSPNALGSFKILDLHRRGAP